MAWRSHDGEVSPRVAQGQRGTVGAAISRPLGCIVRASSPSRPASGWCGPMWASAPTGKSFPGTFDGGTLILQAFGRAMRVIYGEDGEIARKNCRVQDSPYVSGAVRAALVKSSVAVTIVRFHWPVRSREGVGGSGQDNSEESNCLRNASSGDARCGVQRGTGGRSPRRILGTFLR